MKLKLQKEDVLYLQLLAQVKFQYPVANTTHQFWSKFGIHLHLEMHDEIKYDLAEILERQLRGDLKK